MIDLVATGKSSSTCRYHLENDDSKVPRCWIHTKFDNDTAWNHHDTRMVTAIMMVAKHRRSLDDDDSCDDDGPLVRRIRKTAPRMPSMTRTHKEEEDDEVVVGRKEVLTIGASFDIIMLATVSFSQFPARRSRQRRRPGLSSQWLCYCCAVEIFRCHSLTSRSPSLS